MFRKKKKIIMGPSRDPEEGVKLRLSPKRPDSPRFPLIRIQHTLAFTNEPEGCNDVPPKSPSDGQIWAKDGRVWTSIDGRIVELTGVDYERECLEWRKWFECLRAETRGVWGGNRVEGIGTAKRIISSNETWDEYLGRSSAPRIRESLLGDEEK